jgi:AcrR family transcriptional regulator
MESIKDNKLRQILLTARELFWKYGFVKVTVEEICREAGVSKMTFYKHFSNKKELIRFMLSYILEGALEKFNEIMESDLSFTEKVKKQIELKKEGVHGMSEVFLEDWVSSDDPELSAYRKEITEKATSQVMQFYIEAQKKGEIRKDIKPEFIIYFINHMIEMMEDKNLLAMYDTPEDLILEMLRFFFYGISAKK